jgi:phosphoribosylglycinamide formyltransferase 1
MKFRIAIFASGGGTNAVNFIKYFKNHPKIEVAGVYCNIPGAGVIQKSRDLDTEVHLFKREEFKNSEVVHALIEDHIDYIILAGFLWLIPKDMIALFPNRIINIHPALLPKYGGKGMYGEHVHKSVIASNEKVSGITIHLVDEHYDHGDYLFQAETTIDQSDTTESLAEKIHELEQTHFPKVVEDFIMNKPKH